MAITVLGMLYSDLLNGNTNSIPNFVEGVKAISAFYILWRGCDSNAKLDSYYRSFFKGKDGLVNEHAWMKTHGAIEVKELKSYLKNVIENESLNSETRHFSFVCEFTEGAVDDIIKSITDIIQYNKDKEEKERLFNSKVEELKNIFEKQRLDNLQNLTFLFESNNKRIELGDDEEDADTTGEPSGLVEK
jgi:hypothetical protein